MTGPSFRFRLERVQAVRERRETLAKQELASAISRLRASREDLRSAGERLEGARGEQRRTAGEGPIGAEELRARQAFLERTEAQMREQEAATHQREQEVAAREGDLVSAAGEHEMLKRLKERRRGEHEREQARIESGLIDEMASVRFRGRTA